MGIGADIKDALVDVGSTFTILRDDGDISGEYLDSESNRQVTKPFIREYFLEASIPYDTETIAGDVIRFDDDGREFMIMNKTPERFENELVNYETVLYKCNVSGELYEFSGEDYNEQTYQKYNRWTLVKENCYALLTEKIFGTDLDQDESFGQLEIEADLLFIPSSVGVEIMMRYSPVSGEYYKIKSVEKRKFDNVDMCQLEEDTRQ